ncbi:MAG: hypothetical protein IJR93_02625, partial [Treponema sp.]|nr:hypothetical protein [Treponema sp.]
MGAVGVAIEETPPCDKVAFGACPQSECDRKMKNITALSVQNSIPLPLTNCHLYHYAGNNPIKYTDSDGKSESYSDDGYYLGQKDDKIDGIYVYHYDSYFNKLVDIGFLIDTDRSMVSENSFHQTVAMIYGEAEGNDAKEDYGMGEVVKNRMEE